MHKTLTIDFAGSEMDMHSHNHVFGQKPITRITNIQANLDFFMAPNFHDKLYRNAHIPG